VWTGVDRPALDVVQSSWDGRNMKNQNVLYSFLVSSSMSILQLLICQVRPVCGGSEVFQGVKS